MVKVHIAYDLGGAVMFDTLEASEVTIQRRKSGLDVKFPNSDGRYLKMYGKVKEDSKARYSFVNYAQAFKVCREEDQQD